MKRRTARRRMEINLEELDGILDRSTTAPLSKAESQKLKAALHALADRIVQNRSTEKTKSVLPEQEPAVALQPAHRLAPDEALEPVPGEVGADRHPQRAGAQDQEDGVHGVAVRDSGVVAAQGMGFPRGK